MVSGHVVQAQAHPLLLTLHPDNRRRCNGAAMLCGRGAVAGHAAAAAAKHHDHSLHSTAEPQDSQGILCPISPSNSIFHFTLPSLQGILVMCICVYVVVCVYVCSRLYIDQTVSQGLAGVLLSDCRQAWRLQPHFCGGKVGGLQDQRIPDDASEKDREVARVMV